jgi:hypothetical protein
MRMTLRCALEAEVDGGSGLCPLAGFDIGDVEPFESVKRSFTLPSKLTQALLLVTCFLEVPSSNLDLDTHCPHRSFVLFISQANAEIIGLP